MEINLSSITFVDMSETIDIFSLSKLDSVIRLCNELNEKKDCDELIIDFSYVRYVRPAATAVFAREITFIDEMEESSKTNQIFLDGYICKQPVYRKTPLGREIADLLLAVNRPYGKSDYIPCICWGRNARFASAFEVGEHVQVMGRIQSREYMKKITETESQKRVAYEVSVSKLECMDE